MPFTSGAGSVRHARLEAERAAFFHHFDGGSGSEFPCNHALGEGVLEMTLDRALERSGAELRIPTDLREEILRLVADFDLEVAAG